MSPILLKILFFSLFTYILTTCSVTVHLYAFSSRICPPPSSPTTKIPRSNALSFSFAMMCTVLDPISDRTIKPVHYVNDEMLVQSDILSRKKRHIYKFLHPIRGTFLMLRSILLGKRRPLWQAK